MATVDTDKIKALMVAKGFDVTSLAASAGLSRQGLHRLLRPDYEPFPRGFVSLANALGVTPESILVTGEGKGNKEDVYSLLELSAKGEPRAFELLPAALSRLSTRALWGLDVRQSLEQQLLAATGELANCVRPTRNLANFVRRHASECVPGRAFFFSHKMMDVERIMAVTPAAMKKHLVFGGFNEEDFERHFS